MPRSRRPGRRAPAHAGAAPRRRARPRLAGRDPRPAGRDGRRPHARARAGLAAAPAARPRRGRGPLPLAQPADRGPGRCRAGGDRDGHARRRRRPTPGPATSLYGLKRGTEETQLALAGDARGQTLLDFARTRLHELEELAGSGVSALPAAGAAAGRLAVLAADVDPALVLETLATMDDADHRGRRLADRPGRRHRRRRAAGPSSPRGARTRRPGSPRCARRCRTPPSTSSTVRSALLAEIETRTVALADVLGCASGAPVESTDAARPGARPVPARRRRTPPAAGGEGGPRHDARPRPGLGVHRHRRAVPTAGAPAAAPSTGGPRQSGGGEGRGPERADRRGAGRRQLAEPCRRCRPLPVPLPTHHPGCPARRSSTAAGVSTSSGSTPSRPSTLDVCLPPLVAGELLRLRPGGPVGRPARVEASAHPDRAARGGRRAATAVPRPPLRDPRSREETRAHVAGAASAAAAEVDGPPAVEPDPTAAAFFDVDNTMMLGASIYCFARGLAARKYFTTRDLAGFVWQQAKFRIARQREHADDIAHASARTRWRSSPAGRSPRSCTAGEEIYDELMADRIWSGTRALAQQHLDAGQRVWLVTATPVELASIIAHRLGLTGALGTVAEVVDGKYTGRLVGELMHGPAKAEAVLALAERGGPGPDPVHRLQRLGQRPADALARRAPPSPSTPTPSCARSPAAAGWQIRDFRTGRKAAKIGVPAASAAAALSGGRGRRRDRAAPARKLPLVTRPRRCAGQLRWVQGVDAHPVTRCRPDGRVRVRRRSPPVRR